MNPRERIMAVLHHKEPDFIPCTYQHGSIPVASAVLREMRNMGCAVCIHMPVVWVETPNVTVESKVVGRTTYRVYRTPVGKVRTATKYTPLGIGGGTTWTIEPMIKSVEDYKVVKFIIRDAIYHYDPEPFLEQQRWLGDDGIVRADIEPSPLQQMISTSARYFGGYLGFERLAVDLYKHPRELNELYEVIWEKAEECYRLVADSPAEVVASWENIDSVMTNPKLFEKYCLPFYNKMGRLLHQKGKIYVIHCDGRLKALKNLIAKADIDVVESFTPPPGGDLSVEEAREAWGDRKIIWTNIPDNILMQGAETTRRFTRELLRNAVPGDNFIVGIMEVVPPNCEEALRAVVDTVIKYGKYPLSP